MDQDQFDVFTRSLTIGPSRRRLLGLASAGLGLAFATFPHWGEAKKKRRREPKKPKPNTFGCLEVRDACKRDDQCCSGICEGKKGKRTCRAHDTGTCNQKGPEICSVDPPPALTCNNGAECRCFRTTAGSIACAKFVNDELNCIDCRRDADCVAEGYPPGTVCAPLSAGICAGNCAGGMACLFPCDFDLSPSAAE